MENYLYVRARDAGFLIATKGLTLRQAAVELGVSKSTVHKDVTLLLKKIDPNLYRLVRKRLDYHIMIRSYRGGRALKKKLKKVS